MVLLRCAVDLCGSAQRCRWFRSARGATPGPSRSTGSMERARLTPFPPREQATTRICKVSSFATELLEIRSKEPSLHVLLIAGNPGIAAFYKDCVEALYENLGGQASVTAIGHISHSQKVTYTTYLMFVSHATMDAKNPAANLDYEHGRLFSLYEQIDHKVDFIEQELQHSEQPIVLVGHSIGAYIGLEVFKRFQNKIIFFVGLYPFLKMNKSSVTQSAIGYIARSSLLSKLVSSSASLIGSLRPSITRGIVRRFLGPSWSVTAVDAVCCHLLRYNTVRNVLLMAMTEFQKLTEEPDWTFIRAQEEKMAFLFGVDDHWGPLSHLEEISKHAPRVTLSVETEGHTHGYCCTEAGSVWVADYIAYLIKNQMPVRNN
ncbi:lipid droplet-associated hydrolase isoform X1 [Sorghum bicolor]|uniref:lipid droplet-associated hydrolase isoform X1 n=2 Tax=Sorghum bicolor TaxID=4558 RepID=UPI000B426B41|nr:lipid droplet-associated hydrolase isoform X1 [Sorghum bicolor]|eukprot:XP_021313776.1 lipid droplet-associated hydrolase isoform X1 [Sorghum bicolor]